MLENHIFPYTDFHEINLDWVIASIKKLHKDWDDFKVLNSIRFFGQWSITEQYPAWALVSNNDLGYISKKPVPAGVTLDNTEYWGLVADYSALLADMQQRLVTVENELNIISPNVYDIIEGLFNNGICISKLAKIKRVGDTLYPTLKSVTDSIEDGDTTIILLPEGIYDMISMYPVADYPEGYLFPSNTYIIGLGQRPEDVTISSALADKNDVYSTICTQGNFGIYNVKLVAYNTRYAIHDDYGTDDYCTRIFKHCIIQGTLNYYHTVGGNVRGYNHVIYDDCQISANLNMDCFFYHNHTTKGFGVLDIIGCHFISLGASVYADLGFSMHDDSTVSNDMTVNIRSSNVHKMYATGNTPSLYINSDVDIPIISETDYKRVNMPSIEHIQTGGTLTAGHIVEISPNGGVIDSLNAVGCYGICGNVDSLGNNTIVRMGSYCSCALLKLENATELKPIYVDQTTGVLTYTQSSIMIGIAYPDSTVRIFDTVRIG